jgi:hypothetical protein
MRSRLRRTVCRLAPLAAALWATEPALAGVVAYRAELSGKNEVPPNDSQGTGRVEAQFDPESMEMTWEFSYSGLSGPPTAAHFHGPAKPGEKGGAELPMEGPYASPLRGAAKLSPTQAADLVRGLWYLNVHTAKYRTGEIRGQLVKK